MVAELAHPPYTNPKCRAMLLPCQGKYTEAESLLVRATKIWEEALGPKHPHVALALNNRALMLYDQVETAIDAAGIVFRRPVKISARRFVL